MSRTVSLVCYDISHPKRLRRVFAICKSYGDHLQYSVFKMCLTAAGRVRLIAELDEAIQHDEDRILLVRLGPEGPDTVARCQCLGRQEPYASAVVTIV
jgi:CRISPR-associated protein Cas2